MDWQRADLWFEPSLNACILKEEGVFWFLLLWLCFYVSDFPLRRHMIRAACLSLPFLQPAELKATHMGSPLPPLVRTCREVRSYQVAL